VMLAELRGGSFNEPTPNPVTVATTGTGPAATQPAVVQAAVPPTTRPADPFARGADAPTRVVTVILGNEERHVTFQEPAAVRPTAFTDTNTQPAIPN